MKREILMTLLLAVAPLGARADHDIDWDEWTRGEVEVRLQVQGGEGALHSLGQPVRLRLSANEDAYHLVYAIDTEGYVRLLFPRPWQDDGWLYARETLDLDASVLAWPADRWGTNGIVYVEAVASPVPFDFAALGVGMRAGSSFWTVGGLPYRVSGDPFLAFNDVHQALFPSWDQAIFTVDYTYFYVGGYYDAPRYLGYAYQRVYVPAPRPGIFVGVRFGWTWDYGPRYCRPVYARYYTPGRHVVHHVVHHRHHWVDRRGHAGSQWRVPPAPPRRVVHAAPAERQRERAEPARRRAPEVTRQRAAAVTTAPRQRAATMTTAPAAPRQRAAETTGAPAVTRQRQAVDVGRAPQRAAERQRQASPREQATATRRAAPVPASVAQRLEKSRDRSGSAMKVVAGAKAEKRAAAVKQDREASERSRKERTR